MSQAQRNTQRLDTLFQLSLINAPEETVYNKITTLAGEIIGTPVSLMSMVADNYQYFKSSVGLPEPYQSKRRTGFSHSFCKHVVQNNAPLIVEDAREHPLVRDNLAIRDLNVIGYLGIPLTLSDGQSLGSLCVIDADPRQWTQTEIAIMTELAEIVTLEFDTRLDVRSRKAETVVPEQLHERIETFVAHVDLGDTKADILTKIRVLRAQFKLK